jgi:hypothetical protein
MGWTYERRCAVSVAMRKVLVLGVVGGIFLVANVMIVAHWLNEVGAVQGALYLRKEFLTGTAITIIVALLILLVGPGRAGSWSRKCPVCDHRLFGGGRYCSECGSRM